MLRACCDRLVSRYVRARQICGGYPDALAHCAQLIEEHATVDFVDINMGCPIDIICNRCVASKPAIFPCHSAAEAALHQLWKVMRQSCAGCQQPESAWVLPSRRYASRKS